MPTDTTATVSMQTITVFKKIKTKKNNRAMAGLGRT